MEAQWADPKWSALLSYIADGVLPDDRDIREWVRFRRDGFVVNMGVLCHLWRRVGGPRHQPSVVEQIVIPESLRQQVLIGCHGALDAGHRGRLQTYQKVQERYYWESCYSDVIEFVRACGVCQMNGAKPSKVPLEGHLRSDVPGSRFALDVLHVNRQSWGSTTGVSKDYKYILTCVDVSAVGLLRFPLNQSRLNLS